jgi:predicted esterase
VNSQTIRRPTVVFLLICFLCSTPGLQAQAKDAARPDEVERALKAAGANRGELEKALAGAPDDQRKGMAFLVANMPDRDLKSLRADFLLENTALAYKARAEAAWGRQIPEELFLNNVLAYANLDEARDAWRKELYELCMPLVKDCKTPGEAAQKLNAAVFTKLNVRYSTRRKQACQSPKESIDQGMASCTGLSILLSDACRSVAIPTRVAGTPLWANNSGNHTWLEIWDGGWHFAGACEPDPKGLDRGWFVQNASEAKKDVPQHAIYAASFRKTDLSFPLVWDADRKDVFAENVTERYAKQGKPKDDLTRVFIRVWGAGRSTRLALPVAVAEGADRKQVFEGESRGESADKNDMLVFSLAPNHDYVLRVGKPVRLERKFKTTADKEQTLEVELPAEDKKDRAESPGLSKEQAELIGKEAGAFFQAAEEKRAKWTFDPKLDRLLAEHETAVRAVVWKAYQASAVTDNLKKDFADKQVRFKDYVSPFVGREVGAKPKKGWPLVVALHGGGGAPKQVNDSQWQIMQRYYKDHPEVSGYKYLALRAPNDSWNGFYDDYVPPLIVNLIRQFTLLGEVDPDRVYLIGYSHGGYGAFFIGPKIPDRFAAVHSSAAAPTDGTISPLSLRNTRFTFMVGDDDNAYGRKDRCEKFDKAMEKLKDLNPGEFPVEFELKKGFGHGNLPDRDKLKDMLAFTRNPAPHRLTWEPTDAIITNFFWLTLAKPEKGQSIDATLRDNTARITTRKVKEFDLDLDGRLAALDKPLRVVLDGKAQVVTLRPQLLTLCQSLLERGDLELAFTCRVHLVAEKKAD